MLFELIKDIVKLILVAVGFELAIRTYVLRRAPNWTRPFQTRRVLVLSILISAATAIKVTEDVLGQESGPIDEAILWILHDQLAPRWLPVFEAISASGSAAALLPMVAISTLVFLGCKRFSEAKLLLATTLIAPSLIYAIKLIVGRARPELWATRTYWGSSFPSGHTLAVAAIATALALCIGKIQPRYRSLAIGTAFGWTVLVALSRLVLGVHWPTDVLTAACIGMVIPLALAITQEIKEERPA